MLTKWKNNLISILENNTRYDEWVQNQSEKLPRFPTITVGLGLGGYCWVLPNYYYHSNFWPQVHRLEFGWLWFTLTILFDFENEEED